jgi:truncated hemoglobin YjbI
VRSAATRVCRLVDVFYSSIFEDPVLQPVFGSPVATHVDT